MAANKKIDLSNVGDATDYLKASAETFSYNSYVEDGSRENVAALTYDRKTQKWRSTTVNEVTSDLLSDLFSDLGGSDDLSSGSNDSKTSAEKEYLEIEIRTLEGELSLVPSETTLSIKSGSTITINGIGTFLSGKYFVSDRKLSFDSSGISLTLTVIKTGFGDSLKGNAPTTVSNSPRPSTPTVTITPKSKKYVIKSGDTLWKIAVKYYGDGNKYIKIAQANGIKSSDYGKLQIGRELIIP